MSELEINNTASLIAAIEAGLQPRYVLFWGHRSKKGDAVGKHVLSQWWPARFEIDGASYVSAEHYMMAEKARVFGDDATRAQILAADDPGKAKALGRTIQNFDDATWSHARFDIVLRGNHAKFGQNAALRAYLLETGDKVLVEASPVDSVWGIGLAADDPRAEDPKSWPGLNLLGFAIMKARNLLLEQR